MGRPWVAVSKMTSLFPDSIHILQPRCSLSCEQASFTVFATPRGPNLKRLLHIATRILVHWLHVIRALPGPVSEIRPHTAAGLTSVATLTSTRLQASLGAISLAIIAHKERMTWQILQVGPCTDVPFSFSGTGKQSRNSKRFRFRFFRVLYQVALGQVFILAHIPCIRLLATYVRGFETFTFMVLSPKGRGSLVILRKYVIYCDTTGSIMDGYRYGGGRQVAGDGVVLLTLYFWVSAYWRRCEERGRGFKKNVDRSRYCQQRATRKKKG